MRLGDFIDRLEEIREKHGGDLWVETAEDGQNLCSDDLNVMDYGDPGDPEYVLQIG